MRQRTGDHSALLRARELLRARGLDAALAARPANIRYISGFAGTESYLYLSTERAVILTDSRYTLQAEKEGKDCQVRTIGKGTGYGELLAQLLSEDGVRTLGFEEDALLYGTALLFVWLSGKIYRVGILMYGKKPTFKEMAKWLRYK